MSGGQWTAHLGDCTFDCRNWEPSEDRSLRRLWTAGLSCAQIGQKLGRSRSSIISRSRRLKLAPRPSPIKPPSPKSPPPSAAPTRTLPPEPAVLHLPLVPLPPVAHVSSTSVPALPAALSQCAWTESNGRPWVFCDAAVVPGFPYCDQHCRRAYTVWPWRRAA